MNQVADIQIVASGVDGEIPANVLHALTRARETIITGPPESALVRLKSAVQERGLRDIVDTMPELADRVRDGLAGALRDTGMDRPDHAQRFARVALEYPDREIWPDVGELPELSDPVPELMPELLPDTIRDFAVQKATVMAVPLCFIGVPLMITLATVLGRKVCIRPNPRDPTWREALNLWGCIVGRPSSRKSSSITDGLSPLRPLIDEAQADADAAEKAIRARRAALESKLRSLQRAKSGGDENEIEAVMSELDRLKAPVRRYVISDATVEKVARIAADNPNGLTLSVDELAGWIDAFDRPGHEPDRGFYLTAYNGTGSHLVDRVGSGTLRVPSLCISVIGGMQPGRLNQLVHGAVTGGRRDDGFAQRFGLLVYPDGSPPWPPPEVPVDEAARERAFTVVRYLDKARPSDLGATDDGDGFPSLTFDADAQECFDVWRDELERRLRSAELRASPSFEAHLGKYVGLMPKLATICHLASGGIGPVSLRAVQTGAAWCDFLELHARKVYAVEVLPGRAAALALATKITDGAVSEGMTIRQIKECDWRELRTSDDVDQAVAELERCGWVRRETRETGGRPTRVLRLNPGIRRRS